VPQLSLTGPHPGVALEVRQSDIPGAGLGLFMAAEHGATEGSVLTMFGDRLVHASEVLDTPLETYALSSNVSPTLKRVGKPWDA
jgi:hypothetical protein